MSARDLTVIIAAVGAWCGVLVVHVVHAVDAGPASGITGVVVVLAGAVLVVRGRRRVPVATPWTGRSGTALILIVVIGTSAGGVVAHLRNVADARSVVRDLAVDGANGRAILTITDDPRPRRDGSGAPAADADVIVDAQVRAVEAGGAWWSARAPIVVIAPPSWRGIAAGSRVSAVVRWSAPSSSDVVAFGEVRGPPDVIAGPNPLIAWANQVRAGLRAAAVQVGSDGARLTPALVLGDESVVPERITDDLRESGLGHLSAVSGANVAFVLLLVLLIARWAGWRGAWLTALGIATVTLFAVVARLEPSVIRAAAMAAIVLVAAARGGRTRAGPVLAAAVLVLVLLDPHLATSIGFALSVVATIGLVALAPHLLGSIGATTDSGAHATGRQRVHAALRDAVRVTVAAQLAVAPLLVAISGRLDVGGTAANLVVAPAVPLVTVVGFAAALLSLVHPALAVVAVHAAAWPATWITMVADHVADSRWSRLPWPGGWVGAVALAALVIALALGVRASRILRVRERRSPGRRRGAAWCAALSVVLASLVLVAAPVDAERRWPPDGWRIVMCDVGQGDATVLSAGDGSGILIDAGPDVREVDRCLRDVGVNHLALIVLTHFHADHVVGLPGALRGRTVDAIVTTSVAEPEQGAAAVRAAAARRAIPLRVARAGRSATVGGWTLHVLGPTSTPSEGSVPNNASVVLRADADGPGGPSILLLGDAEHAAQTQLVRTAGAALREVDVLKVAHHGSASQDPALTELARPAVAVIGVGCDNRYGHPSPQVLAALDAARATTGRTDRDGDLAVVGERSGLRLVARGAATSHGPASRCG